jgi:hypothetical protein
MKIRPDGPDHSVGDRECRACSGQAWPKRPFDGFRIGNCDGLVHYELIPRSLGTQEVIHRCDSCGMPLNRWGFEEAAWEAAKREANAAGREQAETLSIWRTIASNVPSLLPVDGPPDCEVVALAEKKP